MLQFIKERIKDWLNSYNNANIGFSGKKLSAFVIVIFCFCSPVITWTYWAYKHNDWSLLTGVLVVVSSIIATLFGINVYDKLKNGNTNGNTDTKTE